MILLNKINFANWRIADVDHYMKGNSFFGKFMKINDWKEALITKVGKEEDKK